MPSMKTLCEAGIESALAPIGARLDALKRSVSESQEAEELALKIAALTHTRFKQVMKEVGRRIEAFTQARDSTTISGSPKIHAMQSVVDDLMSGRYA